MLGPQRERAGERGALALAAREHHAALADQRVVAVGQLGDVLGELRAFGGLAHAARDPRSGKPYATFSASDIENRKASCGTIAMCERSVRSGMRFTSTPSRKSWPSGTSKRRGISDASVLLPEPIGPTTPSTDAGRHVQRHVAQRLLAARVVAEREIAELDLAAQPRRSAARRRGRRSTAPRDSTSSMRCIDARPRCSSANTQPMMKVGKVSS